MRLRYRLLVILAVGAVAVAAAACYRARLRPLPVGSGPVPLPVPAEPFAAVWSERPVLLLGLGDSITDGFGARPGRGYFDMLHAPPADEHADVVGRDLSSVLPGLRAENRAVSGSTSFAHVRQVEDLPVHDAAVFGLVVMTTGGNDLIHPYGRAPPTPEGMYGASWERAEPWIAAWEERLGGMLDGLRTKFPGGCRVFLADIYDPTDGVGDIEAAGLPPWPDGLRILAAYNAVIHRCAAARPWVIPVPLRETFLGHGINCRDRDLPHYRPEDPTYWYFENLEDPNERGYDAIRRIFLRAIAAHRDEIGPYLTAP